MPAAHQRLLTTYFKAKSVRDAERAEKRLKPQNEPLQPVQPNKKFEYNASAPPAEKKIDRKRHEQFEELFAGKTKSSAKRRKIAFKLTPLEEQFVSLKRENPDKILAVQVAYKYKFFGKDAQIASKILNIMLIPGRVTLDVDNAPEEEQQYTRFAYCSIPDIRLHVHLRRLLHRGLKVGVVKQKETAIMRDAGKKSSKVFVRKLDKTYTAGTYLDDSSEEARDGKTIVCIREEGTGFAMVAVNVYCADVTYDDFHDDYSRSKLETRLHHMEPIEILTVGDLTKETTRCIEAYRRSLKVDQDMLRVVPQKVLSTNEYITKLDEHHLSAEVTSFIVGFCPLLSSCFCTMIDYLSDFNLVSVFQLLSEFHQFSEVDGTMVLDAHTLRSLEVFKNSTTGTEKGSLFWVLDHTSTPFGRRMLRRWVARPLNDRERILERSGAVENVAQHAKSVAVEYTERLLKKCPDLEVALSKIHYERLSRRDVYLFLMKMEEVFQMFCGFRSELVDDVFESPFLIGLFKGISEQVTSELGEFRKLLTMIYSPAAMDVKDEEQHVTRYFNHHFFQYELLQEHFVDIEKAEDALDKELQKIMVLLKRPNLHYVTNNQEPYLIEIRNNKVKEIPSDWLKINGTKSVSRFRPPEVSNLYKQLLFHKECLRMECDCCFSKFIEKIDAHFFSLSTVIKKLATLDCIISLSHAFEMGTSYVKPILVDTPTIELVNARNPITKLILKSEYIPNSFTATRNDSRVAIITGPNMGGKSSFIRQIALIVIMAQVGCCIPAESGSKLGIFDAIHVRMGAYDDILKGQSTFQVEMSECSTILENCTDRSLVLLDEIGRGTSSVDGCAVAYSILDYLCFDKKPFVLFITHFQNLQSFEQLSAGVARNYHMGFQKHDDELLFTYKLTKGASQRSYGVYCAKLAGISDEIATKAAEVSAQMENSWKCNQARKAVELLKEGKVEDVFGQIEEM